MDSDSSKSQEIDHFKIDSHRMSDLLQNLGSDICENERAYKKKVSCGQKLISCFKNIRTCMRRYICKKKVKIINENINIEITVDELLQTTRKKEKAYLKWEK